jgi:hypothetical protein
MGSKKRKADGETKWVGIFFYTDNCGNGAKRVYRVWLP